MLKSKLLNREISYLVILPKNYNETQKNYPVLYLLHGLFGSCQNWLALTDIQEYLKDLEVIAVLVEGENSWYSDSVIIKNNKFESYIPEELIPEIDEKFRTFNLREKRAVAGLTMGGYGSIKFGLKRPDLFIFAGSMSGAFDAPNRLKLKVGFNCNEINPTILKVFGESEMQVSFENDIFKIAVNYPKAIINNLPYFYLDCGIDDGFLIPNRDFAKLLKAKNISHEFHEINGGHDWVYWNKQLKNILKIVAGIFNRN